MPLEEQQRTHETPLGSNKIGLSRVQQMRNKFHAHTEQENGLYGYYSPATGGIKEGVKKIMELLKLPNLSSITTKLNGKGGIDIVKLDFHPASALSGSEKLEYERHIEKPSRLTTPHKNVI
ncbi:TPA: hypothetical protein QDB51_003426 [Burkholderia vietnamiensis]|nr:hypothetical protein [Burkholderia vietnamiensis]